MKPKEGESQPDLKRSKETKDSLPATANVPPKPKSRLVMLLQKAYSSICPPPQKSQFVFENTDEAAKKNSALLMSFDGDVAAVLDNEKGSTLSPGSEFRDNDVINPLFDLHEDGDKLKELIKHGASYVFKEGTEQTEDERLADITAAVTQGNNHSTRGKEKLLKTRYTNEVERGWMVPFSISEILAIQGLGVIPIGVASQFTINTEKEKVRKDRLTHDCSRPQASGKSVNINTDKDKMEECRFGMALLRVIYQIHMLRFLHPNTPILISKLDLDSAYRRLHVRLIHALLCTSIIGSICYILFRLPFGSAGAPGLFSLFSEFVADISQALYDDETWNPEELFSEMASEIGLGEFGDSPFAVARELSIAIKSALVSIDVYIDDLIVVLLFSPSRYQRIKNVIPLILDCLIRPLTAMEQVKRSSILQQTKLIAEGWFEESKVVLGWLINTRALRIFFPRMKATQLKLELQDLHESYENGSQVNKKLLDSVIGKLVNICFIIPEGRFFINRLRFRFNRCTWTGCKNFDLMESKDLLFWIRAVDAIKEGSIGRSFNSILNTLANIIAFSDACERGLGGFFIIDGRIFAWRFELPEELQGIFTLNLLEFIAAFWTVKIICDYIREARIRSHVDSTNALSWLKKNNHRPDLQPQHDDVARDYGMALLESDNSSDEDYLEGDRNIIADALSRDTHIPSAQFIQELRNNAATKDMMSGGFEIYLENESKLYDYLLNLKQKLPNRMPSSKRRIPSGLAIGKSGQTSYPLTASRTIPFSNTSKLMKDIKSAMSSKPTLSITELTALEQRFLVKSEKRDCDRDYRIFVRGSRMKASNAQ